MDVLAALRSRFASAVNPLVTDVEPYLAMIRPAQDARFGDFQANMAMPLGKALSKPPRDVAAEIVSHLDVSDLCDDPEVAGPGFINLRVRTDRLAAETSTLVADERLGVVTAVEPRTVVVDFSSPNVAKPMHVGHLRSTVIGDALARVYRFLGHRVIGDNHIGDWGTQFGMILYGYKHLLDEQAFEREPVSELARLYRLVSRLSEYQPARNEVPIIQGQLNEVDADIRELKSNGATTDIRAAPNPANADINRQLQRRSIERFELAKRLSSAHEVVKAIESDHALKSLADAHPNIAIEARQETAKLHAGDIENTALWKQFLPSCLEALHRVYDRLGVTFDEELGESHYQPMLAAVVEDLEAKGLAVESDGAICVFNEGFAAPFIVRKADGAFLYATTDLATIRYRVENWHANTMLYVVDKRQTEHFEQLFATARRWGYDDVDFRHVSFGTILGDDKRPFKTRSGDTVGLESLLDEAVDRAYRIVSEGDDAKPDGPELPEEERRRIAEIVGLGGIKYADLKHNRDSDYVFSWEKMLSTTGDTATYMQYAYARVSGIARRGGVDPTALRTGKITISLDEPEERALALQLNRFAEAIDGVVLDNRPNVLTDYLFSLAGVFTSFYDKCPVLKAETEELKTSRLALCDLTARTIAKGLELLGIEVSERM